MSIENKKTIEVSERRLQEYIIGTQEERARDKIEDWIHKSLKSFNKDAKIIEIGSALGQEAKFIENLGYKVQTTDVTDSEKADFSRIKISHVESFYQSKAEWLFKKAEKNKMNDEAHIIVGAVIEKDGKYLLVQELKKKCYMQWNLPLGHLDAGETILDGACREVKEETGFDVHLTDLIDIQNHCGKGYTFIKFTYSGKIISGDPSKKMSDEINDIQWFTHSELKKMNQEGKIRGGQALLHSIGSYEKGKFLPVDLVKVIKRDGTI